jgi:hypothetical protein
MSHVISQAKIKAGRLIRVWNQDPAPNANPRYISVWVEDANGKNERCLLFTSHEIKRAEERAEKNMEDLTTKDFFTDLLD